MASSESTTSGSPGAVSAGDGAEAVGTWSGGAGVAGWGLADPLNVQTSSSMSADTVAAPTGADAEERPTPSGQGPLWTVPPTRVAHVYAEASADWLRLRDGAAARLAAANDPGDEIDLDDQAEVEVIAGPLKRLQRRAAYELLMTY